MARMCRISSALITALLCMVTSLCRCSAQQAATAQTDELVTWDTGKLYAHGISLAKRGIQLNEAIAVFKMCAGRDTTRADYQLALGSACAARFASIACAAGQLASRSRADLNFDKEISAWRVAQQDPNNPDFGNPRPEEPPEILTPDDNKRFTTPKGEVRRILLKLGRQSIAAYASARKLAENNPVEERRDVEYERGWGLFLLRRFGREFVPDEPLHGQGASPSYDVLDVRQSEVIDCFTRCTTLDPKNADNWHSLGLAYVPKTLFAIEYETLQKYIEDAAINSPSDDNSAISALKKALALKPRDFNLLYQAAQIAYSVNPALALDCLDRAAQRLPTNAVLWYFLANHRFKRAASHDVNDPLELNTRAVQDVQTGNAAPQYWAIAMVLPAPPLLKRAWEYVPSYGLTEDPMIIQQTWSWLREFAVDRDVHGDVSQYMDTITSWTNLGLKAIGSMNSQEMDYKDPRARVMRWSRVFHGVEFCLDAYSNVRQSQKDRPDDRKAKYLDSQQDLIPRLQALEKDVIKAPH